MKIKNVLLLAGCLGALSISTAISQQQGPPPKNNQGGGGKPMPPPPQGPPPILVLEAIDTDHDEIISAVEITASADTLKSLDKSSDGKLTREEYTAPPPGEKGGKKDRPTAAEKKEMKENARNGAPPEPHLFLVTIIDTDKDMVISETEIEAAPAQLKTLDKNDDGQLGPGEYRPRPPGGPSPSASPSASPSPSGT